jgi:hypothetical protein
MQQLGLSLQQQQAISDGLALAESLASPLLTQLQQLHAELAAADENPGPKDCADAAAAAAAAAVHNTCPDTIGTSNSSAAACSAAAVRRWSQLPLQQQRADRLLLLLRKDWLVSWCLQCHVLGCLSWQQLGQLVVCRWAAALGSCCSDSSTA